MAAGKNTSATGNARRPGEPRTGAEKRLAAQRAAAARERIAAAQRRRRLQIVLAATAAVVVVVAALVIVKVTSGAGGPTSGKAATVAQTQVVKDVASVPAATLNSIGAGTAKTPPTKITAPPLTSGGKPEVLYVGAEYCPYCAAERWAVAVAMSRFGTLSDVGQTQSSSDDVYPSTQTLSFHGASLNSSEVSFVPREIEGNKVVAGQYAPLDKLTSAQQAIVTKYNSTNYIPGGSNGSIPFVDIGGKYLISGASYDPGVLAGKTHQQIASALSDPNSSIAQAVDGTANLITAALCASTHDSPSKVCRSAGVTSAATKLG